MADQDVTIYHNPKCGTSRNVLAAIRASGVEPTIIEYLKTPPSRADIVAMLCDAGIGARDLLRDKQAEADARGLNDPAVSDDAIIDAMADEPILINRPFVRTPKGAALCRPSEAVLPLIGPLPADFTKEDGKPMVGR